ncbi:MAG: helix-turn-helix domain-containing protein [Bacteroidaceae bacterium]|nr:helix-turn-helix domain-containing protein [Bacteroidaceae bacterium]
MKSERKLNKELRRVHAHIHEVKDEKSLKDVPYRNMVSPAMANSLSQRILSFIETKKIYKISGYTAKQLAKELHTNTRYLSAVVNAYFKKSYSSLINEYRIKEAVVLLADKRYYDTNVEEIGLMVGFANRQSFYSAFSKFIGETPRSFRQRLLQ